MKVHLDWGVSAAAWDAQVAACPRATFFHRRGWYQAHAALGGYRPAAVALRFGDGASAFLPMAVRPAYKGLVAMAHAGIESGYGGLVAPRPLTPAHVEAAYRAVRARHADLLVTGSPHEGFPNYPADGEAEADETQLLPILPSDAQRRRMSATRQKHVKRADKAGFRLEVRTPLAPADVETFYALYDDRAAGWSYKKWQRDAAYFRALATHAGHDMALLLAWHGDRLAGFRILGLGGPVVMDLFLATDPEFEGLHAGPFLVAEALAWCHAHGYTTFDFQPSGRLEGVRGYKATFGAEPVTLVRARSMGWCGQALGALRAVADRSPRPAPIPVPA